jgi:hypothetical protein
VRRCVPRCEFNKLSHVGELQTTALDIQVFLRCIYTCISEGIRSSGFWNRARAKHPDSTDDPTKHVVQQLPTLLNLQCCQIPGSSIEVRLFGIAHIYQVTYNGNDLKFGRNVSIMTTLTA